jgi:flagellar biosynthesis protein
MPPTAPPDVADKNRIAIALSYEHGADSAPKLVAKGKGQLAETILAIARDHGIAVREDAPLAQVLAQVELDQEIPAEAYVAVAEIISYLYRTGQTAGGKP